MWFTFVGPKDLLRRMLKLDPNERASIPEIFNHSWLRFRNVTSLDNQVGLQKSSMGGARATSVTAAYI